MIICEILQSLVLIVLLIPSYECQESGKFLTDSDFQSANKLSVDEIDRGEGIIDTNAEFNATLYGGDVIKAPEKRKDVHGYITKSSGHHWPNGRVPYEFTDTFSSAEKAHIAKAIQFFNNYTCIRIVGRRKTDRNFVKFVKKKGCFAVGLGKLRSGPQELSLGKGCIRLDIIIHELMHAIGFMHEFSRPDRDKYIDINYNNIDERAKPQFRVLKGKYFGDWKLPFDIKSAMFYESTAGSKNHDSPSMVAKNGQQLRCQPHECPTNLDIEKINTVYNCKIHKMRKEFESDNQTKALKLIKPDKQNNEQINHNCRTLLNWKPSHQFSADNDNPVKRINSDGFVSYVCRAEWNGLVISGFTSPNGCRDSMFSGLRLTFKNYQVLTNPNQITVSWSSQTTAPTNAIIAGNNSIGLSYVKRCANISRRSKYCSKYEFLTCVNPIDSDF